MAQWFLGQPASRLLLLAASLGAASCGGHSKHDGAAGAAGADAVNSAAGAAGADTVNDGGSSGSVDTSAGDDGGDTPALWNETSQHIDVRCDSYHFGLQALRGDRTQMSTEQLDLLAQLTRLPADSSGCTMDNISCQVSITDDAGAVQTYWATSSDAPCGQSGPGIAYAPLADLLTVSGCKSSLLDAPPLVESAVCLHGLFLDSAPERQKVILSEPGKMYHLELDRCPGPELAQQLSMQLFGADSAVPIAIGSEPSTPGPDNACLALDVSVTEPITAEVVVGAANGGGTLQLQFRSQ